MPTYPEDMTTEQCLQSDCYKAAVFAFAQTRAMGALKATHPIDPTLWELTEEAKVLSCLPIVIFMPREAALAMMEPVLAATDVMKAADPPPTR